MFDMNSYIVDGIKVYENGEMRDAAAVVRGGRLEIVASAAVAGIDAPLFTLNDGILLPGFADVHVHLREPGFSY